MWNLFPGLGFYREGYETQGLFYMTGFSVLTAGALWQDLVARQLRGARDSAQYTSEFARADARYQAAQARAAGLSFLAASVAAISWAHAVYSLDRLPRTRDEGCATADCRQAAVNEATAATLVDFLNANPYRVGSTEFIRYSTRVSW